MRAPLWIRRKFFDSYGSRPAEQEAGMPPIGIRLSCPCCGYPTLGSSGAYEIFFLCNWEDDGQNDADAEAIRGGPNHGYSLSEARLNFDEYLVMYPPDRDSRVGGADSEAAREVKRGIIAAFDRMLAEPSSQEISALWKVVHDGKKALQKELKRRIREYSTKSEV